MSRTLLRAGALTCALLASSALTDPALAQTEPAWRNLDANGVDLTHGDYRLFFTEASAGTGETALDLVRTAGGRSAHTSWDRLTFLRQNVGLTPEYATVGNAATWDNFSGAPGSLSPTIPNGSSLSGNAGYFTYRRSDGTLTEFTDPSGQVGGGSNFCTDTTPTGDNCILLPATITEPDGRTATLTWELHSVSSGPIIPQDQYHYYRLSSVANSYGYFDRLHLRQQQPHRAAAEPPRVFRRLQLVTRRSYHGKTEDTLSGGVARARGPHGFRSSG